MATLNSAITISRELASVDVNSLTNSIGIDFSNVALVKMRKMLIDKGIDVAPVQEKLQSVTDGTGTYAFPTDMFYVPKSMEVNFVDPSNTQSQNWKPVGKFQDSNMPQGVTMAWARLNWDANDPQVDYRGSTYEILPTPNAATWGGAVGSVLNSSVRIFYYLTPTLYTSTTDTLLYPESLDYFSFARLIKAVYENSIKKITDAEMEDIFNKEVGLLTDMTQGDGMSPTRSRGITMTGWGI